PLVTGVQTCALPISDLPALPDDVDRLVSGSGGGPVLPGTDEGGNVTEDGSDAAGHVESHLAGADGPLVESEEMVPGFLLEDFVRSEERRVGDGSVGA